MMTGPAFYSRGNLSRSNEKGRTLSRPVSSKSVFRLSQKSRISDKSQTGLEKKEENYKDLNDCFDEKEKVIENLSEMKKEVRPFSKGSRRSVKESRPGSRVSIKSVQSENIKKNQVCTHVDSLVEATANNPGFANRNDSKLIKVQNNRIFLKSRNSRFKDNQSETSNLSIPSKSPSQISRPCQNTSCNVSQKSDLCDQEEKSLHIYIKELESLLRKEKFKRIHSEELLKKYKPSQS